MEKNIKKDVCLCVTESLCFVAAIKYSAVNQVYLSN